MTERVFLLETKDLEITQEVGRDAVHLLRLLTGWRGSTGAAALLERIPLSD
jgi:hypothetical protein